jgi:hypothetical protein
MLPPPPPNLAVALYNDGQREEAEPHLNRSLEYLKRASPADAAKKEALADTEIKTRLALMQVWHHKGEPPRRVLEHAKETIARFGAGMSAADRASMIQALEEPLREFFRENPTIDPQDWVRRNFPSLNPR